MRYVGQGHEIAVPLPVRPLTADDAAADRVAYDAEYTPSTSDRPVPGSEVEVMSFAVTLATLPPPKPPRRSEPSFWRAEPARTRKVARHGDWRAVADWGDLRPREPWPGSQLRRPGDRRRSRCPPYSAPSASAGAASRRRATSN